MIYKGSFVRGSLVTLPFNSSKATGESVTLATNGTPKIYLNGTLTEITAGITFTEDHDSVAGRHLLLIDTGADAAYVPGEYDVALDGIDVDGVTPINVFIGSFAIERAGEDVSSKGFAQAGGTSTVVVMPASAPATDDALAGHLLLLREASGTLHSRYIAGYVGASRQASVQELPFVPGATTHVTSYATGDTSAPEVVLTPDGREALLVALAMGDGHKMAVEGANLVVRNAANDIISSQPFTRAGTAVNPFTSVG